MRRRARSDARLHEVAREEIRIEESFAERRVVGRQRRRFLQHGRGLGMTSALEQVIRDVLKIRNGALDVASFLTCPRACEPRIEVLRIEFGDLDEDFRSPFAIAPGAPPLFNPCQIGARLNVLILSGGDVRQLEQRLFVVFGNGQHPLIGDCRLTMEPPAAKPVSDPEEQVHGVVGRTRP